MRVTKRTNIAMRVLMYCAVNTSRLVTKSEIAERCNASENHLAQVINQLAQLGYLATHRGRRGGIALSRPASEIAPRVSGSSVSPSPMKHHTLWSDSGCRPRSSR